MSSSGCLQPSMKPWLLVGWIYLVATRLACWRTKSPRAQGKSFSPVKLHLAVMQFSAMLRGGEEHRSLMQVMALVPPWLYLKPSWIIPNYTAISSVPPTYADLSQTFENQQSLVGWCQNSWMPKVSFQVYACARTSFHHFATHHLGFLIGRSPVCFLE